jgi:hypothetical protein
MLCQIGPSWISGSNTASATASMPKNQADRLLLSHQPGLQGLMISIDTWGAFFPYAAISKGFHSGLHIDF